jgi:hypothetical protein
MEEDFVMRSGSSALGIVLLGAAVVFSSMPGCSEEGSPVAPGDKIPPAAVANLTVSSQTTGSLTATWDAPGDDGTTGTAAQYDIRYSTSPITDANWELAAQVSGEPAPKAPGNTETFVVTGLFSSTVYYIALKTADEKPNWSNLSNVANGTTLVSPDNTPPAAVHDLAVGNTTAISVLLAWTAPGDDGDTGAATQYDIRYSTAPITPANWASASECTGEAAPKAGGSAETFSIDGLTPETDYYFALEATDEAHNWSPLSNVGHARTSSFWSALGSGVTRGDYNDASVHTLTLYNNQLIAGGRFSAAGGVSAQCIATWNGTSWSPLGSGINGFVLASTVYADHLIAGGEFRAAGGVSVNYLAAWNGNSWSDVGGGVMRVWGQPPTYELAVNALAVHADRLIAGGRFTATEDCHADNIAAWDGSSWSALGWGIAYDYYGVLALGNFDNRLITGGDIVGAGAMPVEYIAAWDGSSWSALGPGLQGCYFYGPGVHALAIYDDRLIAAGCFMSAGGPSVLSIAAWDGNSWSPLGSGIDGVVQALAVYHGRLIAAGDFDSAGGVSANNIAAWDGNSWAPLGSGMDDRIWSLAVYDGKLVAGGEFMSAGGISASRIAVWSGD